jgi:hypothetical protein
MPNVPTPSKVCFRGKAEMGREANSANTVENGPNCDIGHCSACPCLNGAAYDTLRAHGAALIYQFCCDRLRELLDERAANASELRARSTARQNTELVAKPSIAAGLSAVQTPMINHDQPRGR